MIGVTRDSGAVEKGEVNGEDNGCPWRKLQSSDLSLFWCHGTHIPLVGNAWRCPLRRGHLFLVPGENSIRAVISFQCYSKQVSLVGRDW